MSDMCKNVMLTTLYKACDRAWKNFVQAAESLPEWQLYLETRLPADKRAYDRARYSLPAYQVFLEAERNYELYRKEFQVEEKAREKAEWKEGS